MSGTPAEIQAYIALQSPRNAGDSEPYRYSFIRPAEDGDSLERFERIYREHAQVKDIVAFADQLGQRVALVVSEVDEADLRSVLDEIAIGSPGCACIADFVALQPDDPLIPALFTAGGQPRRHLIWQLVVGCIETLTLGADRMTPTGERPSYPSTCSRIPHHHDAHREVG